MASRPEVEILDDTLSFAALGSFQVGMPVEAVEAAVGKRGERLSCSLRRARFFCSPHRDAAGDEPYSLVIENDTLSLVAWRHPLTFEDLQDRYSSVGTLVAAGPASDTTEGTLAIWLNRDSTAERMAICVSHRNGPTCSVTLTRPDRAKVVERLNQLQANFSRRRQHRPPA